MAKYFSMDGYVCGDIETRSTASGQLITQFSVNSPERRKVDGEWKSIPNFFKCQYWHHGEHDYRAEYIRDKAHLQLSGEPRYQEWQGDNGKRSTIKFNVDNLFLIASNKPAQQAAPKVEEPVTDSLYDDDIPF